VTDHTSTTTRTSTRAPEWTQNAYMTGYEYGMEHAQGMAQIEGAPEPDMAQGWLDACAGNTLRWEYETPNPLDEFYEVYEVAVTVLLANKTHIDGDGITYSSWVRQWFRGFYDGWETATRQECVKSIVDAGYEVRHGYSPHT